MRNKQRFTCANRKLVTKWSAGPGGMHCFCCGLDIPRKSKAPHNRILRHRAKQELRKVAFS